MRCWILSMAAMMALTASCSVKEDRSECACLLVLDMSSCSNAPDNIRIDLRTLDERIEQNFIPGQDSPFYEYPVTKGVCSLSAYLCPRELSSGTDRITIEEGENCPELLASCSVFEASGETAEHKVVLHKQFATVTLDLEDSPWNGVSCAITAKGEVNGISLSNLKPIEGRYVYEIVPDASGNRSFRLPRQTKSSASALSLELRTPGGSPQVFDLGKYLSEAGYDWQMEDLEDMTVKIKETEIEVVITGSDWSIHPTDVIVI